MEGMNIEIKDEKFFIPHERLQLFPTIVTKMETYKEGGEFVIEDIHPDEFRHFYSFVIDGTIRDWELYRRDYDKVKPIGDFFGISIPDPNSKKMFTKMLEVFLSSKFDLTKKHIMTLIGIMGEEAIFTNLSIVCTIIDKFNDNVYLTEGVSKYLNYNDILSYPVFPVLSKIKIRFENFRELLLNEDKLMKLVLEFDSSTYRIDILYYLLAYFSENEEVKMIDYTKILYALLRRKCPNHDDIIKIKNSITYNPLYKEDNISLWTYIVIALNGEFDKIYYEDPSPLKSINLISTVARRNGFTIDINPFYNATFTEWFMTKRTENCFRNNIFNFLVKFPIMHNIERSFENYRIVNLDFMKRLYEERFTILQYAIVFYKINGHIQTESSKIKKLVYLLTREELGGIWRDFIEDRLDKGDYYVITFFKKKYIEPYLTDIRAKIDRSFLKSELKERTKSFLAFIE